MPNTAQGKVFPQNVTDSVEQYNAFVKNISQVIYERDWELQQIRYAALIGEHVLLKGSPGTAKSLLAKKFFDGIKGSRIYKSQFTRMMDENYLFGVQLLDEYKKGNIKHNTKGSIVDAHFAFLDEFFNASEETLVATNEVLNERTFSRGTQTEEAPLICAIMTTNQDRENEKELRAVYDRILFVSDVNDVESLNNRVSMYCDFLSNKITTHNPELSFATFMEMKQSFDTFVPSVSENVLVLFDTVISEFCEQSGAKVSTRKRNALLKIMKASAFLQERDTIVPEDIEEIKYALVKGGDPKLKTYFETVFQKVKQLSASIELIQKMEKLFIVAQTEKDKVQQRKILVGLEAKCSKLMDDMKNQNNTTTAAIFSSVEKLKERVVEFKDKAGSAGVSDSELFGM